MKRLIVLFLLIPLIVTSCEKRDEKVVDEKRLKVVTSLFPLKEFAQAVAGKRAEVDLLLPPGAEPHTWEPKPSDIVRLSKADIFIYIGAGMEPWIHDILKGVNKPDLIVVEVSHSLTFIRSDANHRHEGEHIHAHEFDPHIWLDFEYAQRIVDKITEAFIKKDVEGINYYQENAEVYKDRLRDLDRKYREALKECRHREIIHGGHSAFAYLAKRYDLKQIPLYGISPDSEPTPKRLARITELAKRHRIRAIYFEAFVSDKLARAIARDVGAKTLILNPGANLTREQLKSGVTFLSMMEKNIENLRYGLECR
ncbi:MAG: metal ABC transporter substrate-binding protein [Nitrospirota bacterium]